MATKKRAARKPKKTTALARSKGQPRRARAPRTLYVIVDPQGGVMQTCTKLGIAKMLKDQIGGNAVVGPYVLTERIRQE